MSEGPKSAEIALLESAFSKLLDKSPLEKFVGQVEGKEFSAGCSTNLLYVRFRENLGNTLALAEFLWSQSLNYALSRRRRDQIRTRLADAPDGDISAMAPIVGAARDAFIAFNKAHPGRASEVGEVLAYCIAVSQFGASQVAAKMSLKTSSNMPVHGLDGIHARVEDGVVVIYFLESKLSKTAASGVRDYAHSVAGFGSNVKQYLLEYSIVRELGNLDTLEGAEREVALRCFDILEEPDAVERRERSIGVIVYSDGLFAQLPPASDDLPAGYHEAQFIESYGATSTALSEAVVKNLTRHKADVNKCKVYFVAVPDVDELRRLFYLRMGYAAGATA